MDTTIIRTIIATSTAVSLIFGYSIGIAAPGNSPSHSLVNSSPMQRLPGYEWVDAKECAALKVIQQARDAQERGDWETALNLYNQSLSIFPNKGVLEGAIAIHAFETGDFSTSLTNFESSNTWKDGHIQGFSYEYMYILAFLLMRDGQYDKAITMYSDAYPDLPPFVLIGDPSMKGPLPSFSKDNPPDSPEEFEADALVGAAIYSTADALGDRYDMGSDGKNHLVNDPYWKPYHDKITMQRFNLALQLQPTSPVVYYYLGDYLRQVPGREADAADAFHKAWEDGNSDMEQRVLSEGKFAYPAFKKAFDARFSDIPH